MPIGLKVKPSSTGAVNALTRLREAFTDLKPALANAAQRLTETAQARFKTKRDPDGVKWRPWSPYTRKARKGIKGASLMVLSGGLRNSVRFIPGRSDIRAYVPKPYGLFHEQPNGRPAKNNLPRRAFLLSRRNGGRALSEQDEQYLYNAIRYQIRKAARQ